MTRYDELMQQLKIATTEEEQKRIIDKITALKAYENAYRYNAKEMELLS